MVKIVLVAFAANVLTGLLYSFCWLRDFWWTFRHKNDPITVFFYGPQTGIGEKQPFSARVYRRVDGDLVFETEIPGLAAYGRLSIKLDEYGTTWCWGWDGEEVEALKVAVALV